MLTKNEAIRRHRLMWNWIADETEKQGRCVTKEEAFEHFGWDYAPFHCWCCAYSTACHVSCVDCPVIWPAIVAQSEEGNTTCGMSIFYLWSKAINFGYVAGASKYARQIANLPEREDV